LRAKHKGFQRLCSEHATGRSKKGRKCMLFRRLSFNSTKSLKLMWKPSAKNTKSKLTVGIVHLPSPKFIIDSISFDADELYDGKISETPTNQAKETAKRTKNQHSLRDRRLKRF